MDRVLKGKTVNLFSLTIEQCDGAALVQSLCVTNDFSSIPFHLANILLSCQSWIAILKPYNCGGIVNHRYGGMNAFFLSSNSLFVLSLLFISPCCRWQKLDDAFIWMGAGNQVTPAHFDNSENLMCMVAGTKKVRLYEPAQTNYLYPVSHTK